ncbi:lipopolysaccharide heptosyltransferase I [Glaciimonas sp. Gout2]|uniref:lipopolysaccharide heptosyltransferase I n=1 Tax=unclassified Glaciimonas TaxID=2644401 RepID=UPI002B227DF4|nr:MULTISPECIES: lipopolysaccharide heptosyltransferase I [unclassified Glaciimonas]MEB0013788.1 lipopolysaccharide heptosyltransferase I [Glaciimonas sp. Cout2]MEB0083109.1 lipopolysaccharide heptosyltransferase I [Glaciimonas sp. Gout2]
MNILIVRVSSLGDVVHNMPMVSDIRRHFPDANIDWVVEEGYASLVRLNPDVRRVIPFALRRWRKSLLTVATRGEMSDFRRLLKQDAYDVVFDTQGLLKTSIVMRMARIAENGKRVGLANATEGSGYEPISRIFHTMSVKVDLRTHAVLRARQVAAQALGYSVDGLADFNLKMPDIPLEQSPTWLAGAPYAVFFHGTARAEKQWAFANWVRIAKKLSEYKMTILLPWGSEAEKQTAEKMAAQMPNAYVLPKLPLMEAVMLAQRASLVIGVDTGLTHVAAAFNRPTIELYCDSPRWKTEGNWSQNIVNLGDEGRSPTVDEVISALDTLLKSVDDLDAPSGLLA